MEDSGVSIAGVDRLIYIGTNPSGLPIYMKVNSSVASLLVSHSAPADGATDHGSYEVQEGSQFSFGEELSVSVTAGFDLAVASGDVTIEAKLSATQMFSRVTTTKVEFDVPPGTTYQLFEAVLYVSYYVDSGPEHNVMVPRLIKLKDDIIYSGATKGISSVNN